MQSFKEGDLVTVTNYPDDPERKLTGRSGPITRILTLPTGEANYFIDVGVPGIFFKDLICYEGEFEHAKEENNE